MVYRLIEYISSTQVSEDILPTLLAVSLCLILGIERAIKHKVASVKTFPLIGLSSCLFAILSTDMSLLHNTDPTRIAAQIVSGVGFVSAGVIWKDNSKIEGITTAVLIWLAAGIGMACGFHRCDLAVLGVCCYLLITQVSKTVHSIVDARDPSLKDLRPKD